MSMVNRRSVPIGHPQKEQPPKPTAFDILTRAVLPIALVAFAQQQEQPVRFWALIALAFLIAMIGFYHIGVKQIRKWVNKLHDRRFAEKTFPRFRRLVQRLGELLDTTRIDTLEYIARERLCRSNTARFEELQMVPLDLFGGFWRDLDSRVEKQQPNLGNLMQSTSELHNLVSSYNRHCVGPVFDGFPEKMRELLTDEAKSVLESFRERFVRFLEDFDEYTNDLQGSLRTVFVQSYYINRPRPL